MDSNFNGSKQRTNGDAETATTNFDPFLERKLENPTTDRETLVHLTKASLGTGILAMPYVFKLSGLLLGVIATIVTSFICSHCSYILVKSAHVLYKRTQKTAMTFAEVAESAFETGPSGCRALSKYARYFVTLSLFFTYFGACAVYSVIIGENAKQMFEFYSGETIDIRWCILIFLLPLIGLSSIRSLKYLVPVSMLANICMAISLSITIFYLVNNLPDITTVPLARDIDAMPSSVSIIIFAIEAIGVVMSLENQMKTPQNFVGVFGVLNQGMTLVTIAYILLGFLAYWSLGDNIVENITQNLPVNEISAQIVKIATGFSVLFTFSLQCYVCIEILWNTMKGHFSQAETVANYILRASVVICAVMVAVVLPSIGPLLKLVGAFGFSCLGLIAPVVIEIVVCWEQGFGRFNWILLKNTVCLAFGLFALVFGSMSAIEEIIGKLA